MPKLRCGFEKGIRIELTKVQVNQLDYVRKSYGMNMSDAIRMLIRQEAVRLSKRERNDQI